MPLTIIKSQFSRRLHNTIRFSLFVSLVVSLHGCATSWWQDAEPSAPQEEISQAEEIVVPNESVSQTQTAAVPASSEALKGEELEPSMVSVEIISSEPPAAGHETAALAHKDSLQAATQTSKEPSVDTETTAASALTPPTAEAPHDQQATSQPMLAIAQDSKPSPVQANAKAVGQSEDVIDEEAGSLKVVEVKAQPTSIERSSTTAALSQSVASFGIWTLERNWDGEHPDSCRLSTPTRQVEIGDHTSQIWLSLEPGRFVVYASSDIFLKKRGVGLRLDQSKLMSFSQQDYPTRTLVLSDLSEQLEKSKMLHVYLVLGEQKSSLAHQEFSLQDMRKAIPALKRCNG
ncbi:hypothetical protein ONV78_14950 [Hahella sp. CR1]|uniref:hypothetical protein n=1 Tax=Hahella sp. CR1 TaxID=2992807 RepID=UPI0024430230|nr:hypothetical protein [Hahella sp. CR1]MDG9669040.1 hypothetical protein [Hahella sp. CR1]